MNAVLTAENRPAYNDAPPMSFRASKRRQRTHEDEEYVEIAIQTAQHVGIEFVGQPVIARPELVGVLQAQRLISLLLLCGHVVSDEEVGGVGEEQRAMGIAWYSINSQAGPIQNVRSRCTAHRMRTAACAPSLWLSSCARSSRSA